MLVGSTRVSMAVERDRQLQAKPAFIGQPEDTMLWVQGPEARPPFTKSGLHVLKVCHARQLPQTIGI